MAPKLSSKRRRKEIKEVGRDTDHADRLSSLPDPILCHIMSFLPTRTSVWTMSLVSRRWRHLWKDIQGFNFEGYEVGQRESFKTFKSFRRFASFVNNVLILRKSRDIRRLRFCWDFSDNGDFQSECAEMWIRAATGPHLQELFFWSDAPIDLPLLLINCTNLVSLCLLGGLVEIKFQLQHSSLHFPSLKNLEFENGTVDSVAAFLSNCPSLETLKTSFYYTQEVPIPISSSSKSLKSTNDSFTWSYFDLHYSSLGIVGNFHSMMEAFLDVFSLAESEFVDPILKDRCVDDYLHLDLNHSTSKRPLHATVLNYPEFHILNHLKFYLPCFNSNLLLNVLDKCHMLEVLIIKSNKEEPSPLRTWEPQSTTVPRCLKSHLTYIHMEGYQGFEDELTFAEYILRNGLVLETMLIFVDTSMDITNKYCSVKRLTDIPRGSVNCQLKFDPTVSS